MACPLSLLLMTVWGDLASHFTLFFPFSQTARNPLNRNRKLTSASEFALRSAIYHDLIFGMAFFLLTGSISLNDSAIIKNNGQYSLSTPPPKSF